MKTKRFYGRLLSIALLCSVFVFGAGISAKAQSDMKTPESRAAMMSDKMKTNLNLTDAEYTQVQALNLKYAQKNDSLYKSTGDRSQKMDMMKSNQAAKDAEMKTILTPDQYTKYEAMVEEMKAKMKEHYKDKNQ